MASTMVRRLSLITVQFALVATGLATSQTATASPQKPPSNDCLDPYWQDTLRCQAFPTETPQPNFGVGPRTPADLKSYTRVFLTRNPSVRSLDGSRPVIYVDKAICTAPEGCGNAGYGEPIESNKWIVSMTGGGSCHVHDSTGLGVFDDAELCLATYEDPVERDEMGTAFEAPMKNLFGINRPDPARNPVFAAYNRVRVEKSSYDRYNGRVAYEAPGGYFHEVAQSGETLDFDLYQQGYPIMEEALRALRKGLRYTTWVPTAAGRVAETRESLPPLADADLVLFLGHSGAAHGLYHNIDLLAEALALVPGFTGDVRAVLDANFVESIENEAAFATDGDGDPLNGDAYTDQWAGHTVGDGDAFGYDGASHYTSGDVDEELESWGLVPDASCTQTHALTDAETWKCFDRGHVAFNHVSTPFFFREDFSDPNQEHTFNGTGHLVPWGDWASYDHCEPGHDPCPPRFDLAEHRARLMEQVQTLLDDSSTRSELAAGVDPSLDGVGAFPTFFAWMPDCGTHAGTYEDASFFDTTMSYLGTSYSLREWLERFVSAARVDLRGWRIDGWSDPQGNTMTSECSS